MLLLAMVVMAASSLHPTALRCDYCHDPLGIDAPRPRLSWIDESGRRAQAQSGYQVLVASSRETLDRDRGDVWDSARVASSETHRIPYGGPLLESGRRVWWKVRVWDRAGQPSGYSQPGFWETGLLRPSDWQAHWIGGKQAEGAGIYLRREFDVAHTVLNARYYGTALGLYVLLLNGKRASSDVFCPGWTDYHLRVQYQTYDVTPLLHGGRNAVGLVLGDGWCCGYVGFGHRRAHYLDAPLALGQLVIRYTDGSVETVATNGEWRQASGPIVSSDMLMGEAYDARKEMTGWTEPDFDDSRWSDAAVVEKPPVKQPPNTRPAAPTAFPGGLNLVAQRDESVRRITELHPVSMHEQRPGVFVFDLGQNMVGWARLRVTGPAGTIVTLRFGEMTQPDGSIYTANLRAAAATDHYTLSGRGAELYEPSFTFHGFRYVEVTGYPGRPTRDSITGVVVSSIQPAFGNFECSNPLVNRLQRNIEWGQMGNYLSVPTDCPQRDERLGWMGDAQIFARTGCFNADTAAFLSKWMDDVDDAQSEEGGFSDVSPRLVDPADGAPGWGDAGVIVPWTVYQAFGDRDVIERHYEAMQRWIDYIHSANPNLLWVNRSNNNFGDWLNVNADMPRPVLATAYFAHDARLVSRMARAIGRDADAAKYEQLFQDIRAAFNAAYVSVDGKITGDTQTCYVLALHFDLLTTETLRATAARRLTDDIARRGGHLSTGFIGVGYLCPTLTDAGYLDVAYRLLTNDTYPSWGYSIRHGATTIWERWDGWTEEHGFQNPGMNSFNHYSLGSVGEWMYATVAGLSGDPDSPGYSHALLHPRPGGAVTWARASYQSVYGRYASAWKIQDGVFTYDVEIPANHSATVVLPASAASAVEEAGRPLGSADGVRLLRADASGVALEVDSGVYRFTCPYTAQLHG